jgi:outer membrane protein OmpA-like peptidoglycan-associated protein
MRHRVTRHRRADTYKGQGSRWDAREADLFWADLVGGVARRRPALGYQEYDEIPSEAMPAGLTASPCDIAKTSETLDQFAVGSSTLTAAHRTTIGTLAVCLLALRGGSRPIRMVDIVGFTDPTGTPTFNQGLGDRRAIAVRDALVADLNSRSAGSAASFTFRPRSAGATQQIAGGNAANRRVEVFVAVAVTDVVVHTSDLETEEIRSNLGAAGLEHFCCVKNTGDIVLEAQITPDVPGAVGGRLTWSATGTAITAPAVGTDGRTAKLSSAASGKFPIELKWDGTQVRQSVVWVIWSRITVTATRAPSTPASPGELVITAGIDHTFTIEPPTIITDADRPALNGPRTAAVPGAARTHPLGGTLAPGATKKWDASRQTRVKILNPHLYPVADLPRVGGHLWAGQPVASTIPENYPANDALGNDDTHTDDERVPPVTGIPNDPYVNAGVCTGRDNAVTKLRNSTGSDGDTFEFRLQYREFLRVNLNTKWFRASDFSLWRFHARFQRAAGAWTDNNSALAPDNNGF